MNVDQVVLTSAMRPHPAVVGRLLAQGRPDRPFDVATVLAYAAARTVGGSGLTWL